MTARLASQRCSTHPAREAAARCPACHSFFCRECVVEHEGRLLCGACVAKTGASRDASPPSRRAMRTFLRGAALAVALLVAWTSFYVLGVAASLLPDDSHAARSAGP